MIILFQFSFNSQHLIGFMFMMWLHLIMCLFYSVSLIFRIMLFIGFSHSLTRYSSPIGDVYMPFLLV